MAHVEQSWINKVFEKKCLELDDLHTKANGGAFDGYDAINIARLLRDLVVDNPLYLRVNRVYKLPVEVPQWVMPSWHGVRASRSINPIYEQYCPTDVSGFWKGGRWYPYSVSEYLTRPIPGFVVGSETLTPGQAIALYANELGGHHLDGTISDKNIKAAKVDSLMSISGAPAVSHALATRICGDVLRALQPLRDAIRS